MRLLGCLWGFVVCLIVVLNVFVVVLCFLWFDLVGVLRCLGLDWV